MSIHWHETLAAAKAEAEEQRRPVLTFFFAPG